MQCALMFVFVYIARENASFCHGSLSALQVTKHFNHIHDYRQTSIHIIELLHICLDSLVVVENYSNDRFEPDMLAFSGCYFGGGEKERFELGEIRKRWATLPVRSLSFNIYFKVHALPCCSITNR